MSKGDEQGADDNNESGRQRSGSNFGLSGLRNSFTSPTAGGGAPFRSPAGSGKEKPRLR